MENKKVFFEQKKWESERIKLKESNLSMDANMHKILTLAVEELAKKDTEEKVALKEEYTSVINKLSKWKI